MKTFNTFAELALAKISTGTPVRVLKPSLIDGIVEGAGEGLTLLSGNVFVPQFNDQEALTGRKTSILDDSFESGFNAFINVYKKNDNGEWEGSANGRTSAIYYNGQLWWPLSDVPYLPGGYQVTGWDQPTQNPNILEVTVLGGSVVQFDRFTGVVGGDNGGSTVSEEPPNNPVAGSRWTRCSDMKSFLWFVDGDGAQWVEDNPSYGTPEVVVAGAGAVISETAPPVPEEGMRWIRCSDLKTFYWYVGDSSSQWIEDKPSLGATSRISKYSTFSTPVRVRGTSSVLDGGALLWHVSREGNLVTLQVRFLADTGVNSTSAGSGPGDLPSWAVPVDDTEQCCSLSVTNNTMHRILVSRLGFISIARTSIDDQVADLNLGSSNLNFNISYVGAEL